MKASQEKWNKRIRAAGANATKFSVETMRQLVRESGDFWAYEGPSYNNDVYREGWERIFGQKNKQQVKTE